MIKMPQFSRVLKLTAAIILAMLMESISATCRASDPIDPAEALRDSVGKIVDAVMTDARQKPLSRDAVPRLIVALLKAGRCDEAYKHMRSVPGEAFQLYCRAMAEAGRADEVPQKVKDFQNAFLVKRLISDTEMSFEQVYTIPLQHGKALRWVSQGTFDSAVKELQTLDGMKRFAGEFDGIAESVFLAIHRKSGAKACLTAIEKYSKDQPAKLKSVTRGVAMKLSTEELLSVIELLPDKHSQTYVAEMSLLLNSQIEESKKRLAIAAALGRMDRLGTEEQITLKNYLLTSSHISAEKKSVFADECVEWIRRNPDRYIVHEYVFRSLVSRSKWDQIESIVSLIPRESEKRVYVIRNLMKAMGQGCPPEIVDRIAAWLPTAAEASKVKRVDKSIPNFLIEGGKLTLAEEWLPKVEGRVEQQALRQKMEFYRVLGATKFADPKTISTTFAALDNKLSFQTYLGTDFLAEIAVKSGAKTALAVARILPVDPQGRLNPTGNCASALLNRGETALAFEVLKLGTPQETQSALLVDINLDRMKPDDRQALRSKLAPFFPNDLRFIDGMIQEAIVNSDKAQTFEWVKKRFPLAGVPLSTTSRITNLGWHDELADVASQIESQATKTKSQEPMTTDSLKETANDCVQEIAWSLLNKSDQAGPAVVAFVKKHVRSPEDRIELFLSLTSDFFLSR